MLVLQNQPHEPLQLPGLSWEVLEPERGAAQLDLTLYLREDPDGGLSGGLEYATDLFDERTMRRMMAHFRNLLEGAVADPGERLLALPLMTAEERQSLLAWNDTTVAFPQAERLHDAFERQASQRPDAIAVTCGETSITYGELDLRANRLAHALRQRGVDADRLVGVYLDRSVELVVALLGILKAGGGYVPLDPSFPAERLQFMLEDAKVPLVITTRDKLVDAPRTETSQTLFLDSDAAEIDGEVATACGPTSHSSDRAYVIYTSGSTGKPKGVEIPHTAAVNFLRAMAKEPGLTAEDILLSVTTLSFDISVLEIFGPLSVGGHVVLATKEQASDGLALMSLLSASEATVLQATPMTWRLLLEAGWPGDDRVKLLCGGEALSRELADELLDRGESLWNMYGPTETTVWSAVDRVELGREPVWVGRPIDNTQFYVVDEDLQPVPLGVPGELLIGGAGLAHGYLDRARLTAERFLPDAFDRRPEARVYRTGDLVRFRGDGRLEFFGRIDHQIKIRGFRVELGEIEAVLRAHPRLREAVVVARQARSGDTRLVCYAIPEATAPSPDELQRAVRASLPDYMTPTSFVFLDAFPQTPNRKVDRKALPAPDDDVQERPHVELETPLERLLAETWCSVLGLTRVSADANFFDLGGHSLLSMKVVARIESRAGFRIDPNELIFQTLRQIARANERRMPDAAAALSGSADPKAPDAQPDDGAARTTWKSRLAGMFGRGDDGRKQ